MVGAHDVAEDVGRLEAGQEAFGDEEVVDAPAYVLLAGAEAVAPPCVGAFNVAVDVAEGVGKAGGLELAHLFALLVGEAGVAAVALGVLEVDFFLGHVHVAADDHGLLLVQVKEVGAQGVFPLHAEVDSAELFLGVGAID